MFGQRRLYLSFENRRQKGTALRSRKGKKTDGRNKAQKKRRTVQKRALCFNEQQRLPATSQRSRFRADVLPFYPRQIPRSFFGGNTAKKRRFLYRIALRQRVSPPSQSPKGIRGGKRLRRRSLRDQFFLTPFRKTVL